MHNDTGLAVANSLAGVRAVKAVQVEHIRLTLGLKALGCQPSTS